MLARYDYGVTTTESPSPARDRVLDSFEDLLIEQGERAATLDAVAKRASVSKGGLLYHFGSKDALAEGLIERLEERQAIELTELRAADDVVAHFLRTSISADTPFDRTILATARLAQGSHPLAKDALGRLHDGWFGVVSDVVSDPVVARAIVLISDGLYYNSALLPSDSAAAATIASGSHGLQELVDYVQGLVARIDR